MNNINTLEEVAVVQYPNEISRFLENTLNPVEGDSFDWQKIKKYLHTPSNSKNKKGVFVGTENTASSQFKFNYIQNLEEFGHMIESLLDVRIEKAYCGQDADEVTLYTATLPDQYVAGVPLIKVKHLPDEVVKSGKVKLHRYFKGGGESYDAMCCRWLFPIISNQAIGHVSQEEIKRNYHCISIKINNKTDKIISWSTGRDPEAELIMSNNLDEQWCEIGGYYPVTTNTFEQAQ